MNEQDAIYRHTFTNTLMIDNFNLAVPVEEVAYLNRFNQGAYCGGQREIMRQSTRLVINLGTDIMHTAIQNSMGNYPMLLHL